MKKLAKNTLILSTVITSILPTPSHANDGEYIKITTEPNQSDAEVVEVSALNNSSSNPDIILRPGEFGEDKIKDGKRLYVNEDENYNNLPVLYDKEADRYYIPEYYFNKRLAEAIYKYLQTQGVNVQLQTTKDKSEDLNRAGRIAKSKHPIMYISIHHNAYDKNSSGYFLITNNKDALSSKAAQRLSYSLEGNKLVPRMQNRRNVNNYIGELNEKPGKFNILFEAGFALTNKDEAMNCSSDEYIDYVAKHFGDELIQILQEFKDGKLGE